MSIKEFWESVRDAMDGMAALQRKRDDYLSKALSLSGMSENTIRSTEPHSRTESAALMLVEIADEIDRQWLGYAETVRKAEKILAAVESEKFREILDRRYMQRQSWKLIAEAMHYKDLSGAFKAHGWALLASKKIWEKM